MTDIREAPLDEAVLLSDTAGEQVPRVLEKILTAARPDAVFGQPVESGSYTIITAAEVTSGGGFGVGMGRGQAPKPEARQAPPADGPAGEAASAGAAGPWAGRWRSSPSAPTV